MSSPPDSTRPERGSRRNVQDVEGTVVVNPAPESFWDRNSLDDLSKFSVHCKLKVGKEAACQSIMTKVEFISCSRLGKDLLLRHFIESEVEKLLDDNGMISIGDVIIAGEQARKAVQKAVEY